MKKYTYYKVLQGYYYNGYEDLCFYDTSNKDEMKELKSDLKAYRENERGISFRIITRRILNK